MPDTSPSPVAPPPVAASVEILAVVRTLLGVGSLLSLALASALAVVITAFFGPHLARLLAMYGGNLEPTLPITPFPWVLAVLAVVPAVALATTRRFGLAGLALTLEFVVCGWQIARLVGETST